MHTTESFAAAVAEEIKGIVQPASFSIEEHSRDGRSYWVVLWQHLDGSKGATWIDCLSWGWVRHVGKLLAEPTASVFGRATQVTLATFEP
jgi:hypothetical protein